MRKPVIGTIGIIGVAAVFYFFAPEFSGQALYTVVRPVWNTQRYLSSKLTGLLASLQNTEVLGSQNRILADELGEARLRLQSLETYKKENEELKSLLGRTDTSRKILAAVLQKPGRSVYDSLVLDAGRRQGVSVGDTIMSADFVIGTIREVYPDYAKATLLSTPGETLPISIGDTHIETEGVGRGGGNFTAKLPKEIPIKKGDLVKIPGLESKFLGSVEDIEVTPTGSFQFILFSLPVNIYTLERVLIVKS